MPSKIEIIKENNALQLILPDDLVEKFKDTKRVLCVINDIHEFHVALKHSKDGYAWVWLSKANLKSVGGEITSVSIEEDTSPLQFYESPVLNEVLASDPHAQECYNSLTDGKKRNLIYAVYKIKSPDKKIEKALLFAENLKRGYTDFRDLNKKIDYLN